MFLYPVGNLSPGGVNVDVRVVLEPLDSNLIAFPRAILIDVLVWFSITLSSVCKEQVDRAINSLLGSRQEILNRLHIRWCTHIWQHTGRHESDLIDERPSSLLILRLLSYG